MMGASLMQPGSFRWDDVALLMACQRAGTLSAAARTMALDPATASRRLTQLEESLGIVLFHRGRDGLLPTAALQTMLPAAEAAEVAMLRFAQSAGGVETAVQGVVRLTMPPGVADSLVTPLLPALLARHPGLRLEIDASTRYVDLHRREADLALRTQRPQHGDLLTTRLLEVRPAVMGAPQRFAGAAPAPLATLQWITWDHDLAHLPEARWVEAHAAPDAVVVRTSSMPVQFGAAHAGLGVLLCAQAHGRQAGLVQVPLPQDEQVQVDALPAGALWLVCHRSVREVPRVKAVWDFLRQSVDELQQAGAL